MSTFRSDITWVVRSLRRTPVVAVVSALSIALGVGANTAVYSWLNSLVLKPFPGLKAPHRLVGIESRMPNGDVTPMAFPMVQELRDATNPFTGIAVWSVARVSARESGESASESLVGMTVSGNYFTVVGGRVARGRALTDDDERLKLPVVVLSHAYWQRRYGADPSVVGRAMYLNGEAVTIVGIAGPRFVGTYLGVVPELFVPVSMQPALTGTNTLNDRRARTWQVVARLAPGVTAAQARVATDALARTLSLASGDRPVLGAEVKDVRLRYLGGIVQPLFLAMLVVTALLLAVACANIAGLLVVRAATRRQEFAVRVALGASRAALARLVLVESAILAVAGSALGVVAAYIGRGALYAFIPTGTYPITLSIAMDARVFTVAGLIALAVTLASGLAPALRASNVPPAHALRYDGRSAGGGSRIRTAIVVSQLVFSLLCLTTAGLFVSSLRDASLISPGFTEPERVLLVNTNLGAARLRDSAALRAMDEMISRARALPGVRSATVATVVPLGLGGRPTADIQVEGRASEPDENRSVIRSSVGSEYAMHMGTRVVTGRDFTDADRADALSVALVNETLAERFLGGTAIAVGKRIDLGRGWATVVGVLANGKYLSLAEAPQPVAYVPIAQWYQPAFTLQLRTEGNPRILVEPVRKLLQSIHVDLPALQARTLAEHIAGSTFVQRTGASVLGVFAAAALLLAVVGLYGTLSSSVARRSREIAIRVALGAGRMSAVGTVIREALTVAGFGVAIGAPLALGLTRAVQARVSLPGASPVILLATSALLLSVAALAAAFSPSRRALRVDPARALRDG